MTISHRFQPLHLLLLAITTAVFVWSGIEPKDRLTWFLEVAPVLGAVLILVPTYHRFRLTDLLYVLITLHAVVLMIGGHYTYAEVPFGFWMQDAFGFERNHYDRIGHFLQGFVPALIAREVLLRLGVLARRGWLFFVVTAICLAISAFYEFIEWWAALVSEQASQAFLGTQGDVWDTQWDMFLAMCGAMLAQVLLGGWQDRQLARLKS